MGVKTAESHTHTHTHTQDAKRTTHSLENLSTSVAEGNRLVVGSSSADNLLDASPILHHVERNLALGSGEADSVEPITDTKKGRDSGGRVCIVEMYLGPLKSFGDGPFLL